MRTRRTYFVYIIGIRAGKPYIGMPGKLEKRFFQHQFEQIEGFTEQYEVHRLLYWESYDNVHNAINRERQLKGWLRSKSRSDRNTKSSVIGLSWEWYPQMKESVPRVAVLRLRETGLRPLFLRSA